MNNKPKFSKILLLLSLYYFLGFFILMYFVYTSSCDCPYIIDYAPDCYCPDKKTIFIHLLKLPISSVEFWLWQHIWPFLLFQNEVNTFINYL